MIIFCDMNFTGKTRWNEMRFLMSIMWALLIGGALTYVLSSMANAPYDLTQSLALSATLFIGILLVSGVLGSAEQE